jgi:hypothetical protein
MSASAGRGSVVELRDGTRALIRPIGPSDRERLKEGFESARADSNFQRFFSPKPRLSSSELVYLTAVEHPETAEFAIGVGDRWMGIGLGTALLRALVLRACQAGVKEFTGLIRAENTAVKRLIGKVLGDYETRFSGQGAMEVVVDLRAAPRSQASAGSQLRFLLGAAPQGDLAEPGDPLLSDS